MGKWIVIASLLALVACSSVSSQSFYEGVRSQDKAKGIAREPSPSALPSFQQYQQERQGLKGATP
jgi:uncharacterized lipoprotein YmbA